VPNRVPLRDWAGRVVAASDAARMRRRARIP